MEKFTRDNIDGVEFTYGGGDTKYKYYSKMSKNGRVKMLYKATYVKNRGSDAIDKPWRLHSDYRVNIQDELYWLNRNKDNRDIKFLPPEFKASTELSFSIY